MTNSSFCCVSLSNRIKPNGIPFAQDGKRVYLSYATNERSGRIYLAYCPFCGFQLPGLQASERSIDGLSQEQMVLTEKLLDGIVTREDVALKLGPPSREIPRQNGIVREMHYDSLIGGVSIAVLERDDGYLEFMYSFSKST